MDFGIGWSRHINFKINVMKMNAACFTLPNPKEPFTLEQNLTCFYSLRKAVEVLLRVIGEKLVQGRLRPEASRTS